MEAVHANNIIPGNKNFDLVREDVAMKRHPPAYPSAPIRRDNLVFSFWETIPFFQMKTESRAVVSV